MIDADLLRRCLDQAGVDPEQIERDVDAFEEGQALLLMTSIDNASRLLLRASNDPAGLNPLPPSPGRYCPSILQRKFS